MDKDEHKHGQNAQPSFPTHGWQGWKPNFNIPQFLCDDLGDRQHTPKVCYPSYFHTQVHSVKAQADKFTQSMDMD